jgi:DNA polymerase III alpha subunit
MRTNEFGQVNFTTQEILDSTYQGINGLHKHCADAEEIDKWNQNCGAFELDAIQTIDIPDMNAYDYHKMLSEKWITPKEYDQFDIQNFLVERMEQLNIMSEEYTEYLKDEIDAWNKLFPNGPEKLWKFLHYLIETCKEKDIVNGVGRGSSVSSLVLYLLGVHYVDPIKYKLSYKEFLR